MPDLTGFDASEHEPTGEFEPMPKDDYLVIATGSEWKPTKAKDGEYLQFLLEVVEGEHKGRKLWDRLNLKNKNDTAVRIANGTLSAICRAVGVMKPKDSSELHNKAMIASVIIEERNDKPGSFKNEVKAYKSTADAGQATTTAASTGNGGKAPWAK